MTVWKTLHDLQHSFKLATNIEWLVCGTGDNRQQIDADNLPIYHKGELIPLINQFGMIFFYFLHYHWLNLFQYDDEDEDEWMNGFLVWGLCTLICLLLLSSLAAAGLDPAAPPPRDSSLPSSVHCSCRSPDGQKHLYKFYNWATVIAEIRVLHICRRTGTSRLRSNNVQVFPP